jgi:hypothetical protein
MAYGKHAADAWRTCHAMNKAREAMEESHAAEPDLPATSSPRAPNERLGHGRWRRLGSQVGQAVSHVLLYLTGDRTFMHIPYCFLL